jgi:hypothetical protein
VLDDLRGLVLLRREEADEFLKDLEQRQKRQWMDDCQKMAQKAESHQSGLPGWILTINDWEFRKALDAY